jgi:hypothetical protein
MSVPIITERKKWKKKAQRIYPGRQFRWMYGQLWDFGREGKDYPPRDVPAIPVVLKEKGKTLSADKLFPQRTFAVSGRSKTSPDRGAFLARKPAERVQEKFVPLDEIAGMSIAERLFLKRCDIKRGYSEEGEFIVERIDGRRFFGSGDSNAGWTRVG